MVEFLPSCLKDGKCSLLGTSEDGLTSEIEVIYSGQDFDISIYLDGIYQDSSKVENYSEIFGVVGYFIRVFKLILDND